MITGDHQEPTHSILLLRDTDEPAPTFARVTLTATSPSPPGRSGRAHQDERVHVQRLGQADGSDPSRRGRPLLPACPHAPGRSLARPAGGFCFALRARLTLAVGRLT